MKLHSGALSALLLAPTLFAGLVPVSRTSTYSGHGYYSSSWNYPYEPVVYYDWNNTDSCNVLGSWTPSNAYSYLGFWHFSNAAVNQARFIASAQIGGHSGHTYNLLDDQRTSYEYVFDVTRTTRVNIVGFGGVKLTSVAGFSLLGSAIPSGGKDYTLPPSRYTVKDTFVNGHGEAHFELHVLSCLGDINNDAQVNDTDFVSFLQSYATMICSDPEMASGCPADLNYDNIVDDGDFVLFGLSYDTMACP